MWWNGIHGGLKILRRQRHAGSSPATGTNTIKVNKMKPNTYRIITDCLEEGITVALNRMDKHAEDPLTDAQRDRAAEHLEREIINAICEKFNFEHDNEL